MLGDPNVQIVAEQSEWAPEYITLKSIKFFTLNDGPQTTIKLPYFRNEQ